MPNYGLGSKVSLGEESTAGTPVSRTIAVPVLSVDFQQKRESDTLKHLLGSGTTRNPTSMIDVRKTTTGSVELDAYYKGGGLGMLLKHAIGGVTTTGSGPYTHTYALSAALPNGLTVAVERGNTGADEVHAGCKINRLVISQNFGEPMKVTADFVGMTSASRTGDTPPSMTALTSRFPVKHYHCGQLSFNSVDYKLKSFTLTIDNKVVPQEELGALTSSEPVFSDFQEITLQVVVAGTSNTLNAAHIAATASDVGLTFSDSPRSLAFTLHNAQITDYSDPISGMGIIEQSLTFRSLGDDTDHGLAVVLVNADSSAVAS